MTPRIRAAIGAALAQRRDKAPLTTEDWPAALACSRLEWTGFAMTTNEVRFRAAASVTTRSGIFRRPLRHYWVFAGGADAEHPDAPVSCHSSLALAAEMLMTFYAEICTL